MKGVHTMSQDTIQALPNRNEIEATYKWKLEDIYVSDEAFKKEYEETAQNLPQLEAFKGSLATSSDTLLKCLQLANEISKKIERIYTYAFMRLHEDSTNSFYQGLSDQAQTLSIKASSTSSFIVPEILTIPTDTLHIFMRDSKEMEVYTHYLQDLIRQKAHILSADQEEILAQAGELAQAPKSIFSMLNDADIRFGTIKNENDQSVEVTHGRFITFLESKDRRVRQEAFKAVYTSYQQQKNTLAATLSASVKQEVFFARVRKYDSALHAALHEDNTPLTVYTNLIDTVHNHLPLLHRYMALRKKRLGLEELHMYDLHTPIVQNVDISIPFEEAKKTIEKALAPLGEEYLKILRDGYNTGWIDVYENKGKRSGAYSWGAYGTHPYVLLNYQDNVNNMFTLAHEMGHALHSYYSDAAQPYIYAGYKIFVAEVASTVNEALLMEYMLAHTTAPKEKEYLLNYYMEQFRTTLYRQVMFAEFEKITHEMIEKGESLTPDVLCAVYRDLNVQYYGSDVVIDDDITMEWARIPHFYNGFYVYQYATGYSSAIALSQKILTGDPEAVDQYITFLKSGNSNFPIEILKKTGVDMTTPEPIERALKVFEELLTQMEALTQ